ncbi:MAG: alpha/beta hydrolase family protein [Panacagrimonas sp.]
MSRLSKVLAVALLLLSGVARAQIRAEAQLELSLDSGRRVLARIVLPTAPVARLPAVILLGGFERGAAALDLIPPGYPAVLASFDYPLVLPDSIGLREGLRLLPEVRRAVHDTQDAIGLLHAALAQREDVDTARISIVGVSLGAPFAVIAAADHGIPGLAVIHGFGRLPQVIGQQFIWRWDVEDRVWARPLAWLLGQVLARAAGLPDVELHAQRLRAHQRVLMLSAADDERIPTAATRSLIHALHASAAQVQVETEPGDHLSGEADPRIPLLLQRTDRWRAEQGL